MIGVWFVVRFELYHFNGLAQNEAAVKALTPKVFFVSKCLSMHTHTVECSKVYYATLAYWRSVEV